jgi:hypothetical protein
MAGGGAEDAVGQGAPELPPLRPLMEFHRDPNYGGDLHRADMAWARHAAAMGAVGRRDSRGDHAGARPCQEGQRKTSARICRTDRRQGGPAGGVRGTTGNRRQSAAFYCRTFAPAQPVYPAGRFSEEFSLWRLRTRLSF